MRSVYKTAASPEFESNTPGGRTSRGPSVGLLVAAATALLIGQLLVGTSVYFAIAVYASLIVVIVSLRIIGFASIAGILITYLVFRYLIFSQIIKTIYGQPGDTNLSAPDTTISILLVGITLICVAAILVSQFLGNHKILKVNLSNEGLVQVRNISLTLGLVFFIINLAMGGTDASTRGGGGITQIAKQLGVIIYLSVLAETWCVLRLSNGRRSLSPLLFLLIGGLTFIGFLFNSKRGLADPFVMYFFASFAYRHYVTRKQLAAAAAALLVGIFVAAPIVQLMRVDRSLAGQVRVDAIGDIIYRQIFDSESVAQQKRDSRADPNFIGVYDAGLLYLGNGNDVLGRFLLIANTDVIVAAVNESGPYEGNLITMGLEMALPTFLAPDKPRENTGDLLTWYYGLRNWGVNGNPAIGIFADSYATWEWTGVAILPFLIMLVFFTEIQLTGRHLTGNFFGAYLLFEKLHPFGESGITAFLADIIRGLPIDLMLFFGIVYLSDLLIVRRRGLNRPA